MRRSVRHRLSLLLVAIAILAFAAWQWRQENQEAPGTLLALEPSAISRVEVHIGNAPTEHYAKRGGHWYRIDGAAVRADDGRLVELTETAAASVLRWRPAGDFDAARIGLTPPSATLKLDGHALDFGEISVTGPQCYVRVDGRVALVSVRYMPRASRGQADKLP
ncbi:hypothetical protein [Rhodanobacter sp. BL-MT-08]